MSWIPWMALVPEILPRFGKAVRVLRQPDVILPRSTYLR